MSAISCEPSMIPEYSKPAGPLDSQPPYLYISSCDFTHLLATSGATVVQSWLRFQKVFQNASQPRIGDNGSASCLTFSHGSTYLPFTSLKIERAAKERYMFV